MRALVWTGPRQMEIQDVPVPRPAPGEVLLRVDAVGICGSELSGYLGHNSLRRPPLIMGHEFSATVMEANGTPLATGERVVVNPLSSCGQCGSCRRGEDHLCPARVLLGAHRPGAFAEFVAAPARSCIPLPAAVDAVTGALVEPLACGLRAVVLSRLMPGETALICGGGPIGLAALVCARAAGALLLAVTEVRPDRRGLALAWGATHALDPRGQDPVAAVRELTGGAGADVVIDAVGTHETRRQGLRALRPGGRLILTGLHDEESPLEANYAIRQEITVQGSFAYTPDTFHRALALAASGILPRTPGWLHEDELARGPDHFAALVEGRAAAAKIMLRP